EDFEMEKQVILEEISMYQDQPPFGIDDKSKELFFGDHPLSRSVLGTLESVKDLTVDQMRSYFDRQYSPGNIVFAAAGNFDFDRLAEEVEKYAGSWAAQPLTRSRVVPAAHQGTWRYTKESSTQDYVFQIFSAPSAQCGDQKRYSAVAAANMIGDDVGSRMFWDLIDNGAADTASLSYCDYSDAGTFTAVLCCDPGDTSGNLEIMNKIFQQVQKEGFSREELERARNKILSHIVLASERPIGRFFSIGSEWLQTQTYTPIHEEIEHFKKITLDQIHALLGEYPLNDPLQASIGPENKE
ncbi:MAG: pitrilysin family protein, partial [Planctomycetia bacterium]|nr:pitrilysin family protein [Planctomycetia bacterium]